MFDFLKKEQTKNKQKTTLKKITFLSVDKTEIEETFKARYTIRHGNFPLACVAGASSAKEEISRTRERRKGEEKTLVSHLHPQNNMTVLHQLSKNMIERRSSNDTKPTSDVPGRIASCTTNRIA